MAKGKDLPEQVMKAQRRRKGTAAPILHLDGRCGWIVNAMPRPLYPQEMASLRIGPRAGLDGCG